MSTRPTSRSTPRGTLSRDQILAAAVELADRDGRAAVTMRSVAAHVGVEAMSLYHHVHAKEDLLDGMVDTVFSEIHRPVIGNDWRSEMRTRSISAREVLLRHRWAIGLMDSRTSPGVGNLSHHDAVLGCLRAGGFSVPMAAHAFALLDSHLYGFVLQEVSLPFEEGEPIDDIVASMLGDSAPAPFPHLMETAVEHVLKPGYAFGDEFPWGLDLILDALERAVERE